MPRKQPPIEDQLRKAIAQAERRGVTKYRLAKQSGLSPAAITRLMTGERSLSIASAEKLAEALGLKLVLVK